MFKKEFVKSNRRIAISVITLLTTVSMTTSAFAAALTTDGYEKESAVDEVHEEEYSESEEQIQFAETQIYVAQMQLTKDAEIYLAETEAIVLIVKNFSVRRSQ